MKEIPWYSVIAVIILWVVVVVNHYGMTTILQDLDIVEFNYSSKMPEGNLTLAPDKEFKAFVNQPYQRDYDIWLSDDIEGNITITLPPTRRNVTVYQGDKVVFQT